MGRRDMPLMEGQFKVRDLIMGPGTRYEILRGTNPFQRNVRADQGGARAWNHGSWSGVEWAAEVVVPMTIRVRGASSDVASWLAAHQTLTAAFAPVGESAADAELRFMLGGTEFLMRGRPRMVEPDLTLINSGKSITQAAFVALDPFIYAGTETVAGPTGLPTFSGGLTVPVTAPFTVSGVLASGFLNLTNTGTAETPLSIRIDGPVQEPSVTLQRTDGITQALRFGFDLETGQWLDIDTGARTVMLNGASSRRGQTAGDFPILPAGTHVLQFRAGEYNPTATVTVRFRSAWW